MARFSCFLYLLENIQNIVDESVEDSQEKDKEDLSFYLDKFKNFCKNEYSYSLRWYSCCLTLISGLCFNTTWRTNRYYLYGSGRDRRIDVSILPVN